MGFCRRCGDIVAGARCECGGAAVAPVVSWNDSQQTDNTLDKWSKTYITREPSISPVRREQYKPNPASSLVVKPLYSRNIHSRDTLPAASSNIILDDKVSEYITRTTSQPSSSVPSLKPSLTANPNADILPSVLPHDTTLSKVYGSLLQPKESLSTHSCALCLVAFPPDATIYPDPSEDDFNSDRFLCRQCYISNGGSKGACALCSKPVLTLKSDGGFIHAAGKYWHKQCFNCDGCSVNVSDSPMVDLFGRPSCLDCFETCLKRDSGAPPKSSTTKPEARSNLGGMKANVTNTKFRESSPGIEELEQRLGIVKARQGSPALEELSQRLNIIGKEIGTRQSPSSSPTRSARCSLPSRVETVQSAIFNPGVKTRRLEQSLTTSPTTTIAVNDEDSHVTSYPIPTQAAIEEMKQRFLKSSIHSSSLSSSGQSISHRIAPLRTSRSVTSLRSCASFEHSSNGSITSSSSDHLITDLLSDMSGVDTSPGRSRGKSLEYNIDRYFSNESSSVKLSSVTSQGSHAEDDSSSTFHFSSVSPSKLSNHLAQTSCGRCGGILNPGRYGGRYIVAYRGANANDGGDAYHPDCFRCVGCGNTFQDDGEGKTVFTQTCDGQPCHIQCAPTETIPMRKPINPGMLRQRKESKSVLSHSSISSFQTCPHPPSKPSSTYSVSSSRYERSAFALSTVPGNSSRFGSRTACPGCNKPVSPMEFGVVPGPQSTRWHAVCLVCGGKKETPKGPAWILNRGKECNKKAEPGCGKKLDSAARIDHEGRVWCRECL
ncbi:hypothetical protein BDQ17DRAFT_1295007, partial [Cyathus striatus]